MSAEYFGDCLNLNRRGSLVTLLGYGTHQGRNKAEGRERGPPLRGMHGHAHRLW